MSTSKIINNSNELDDTPLHSTNTSTRTDAEDELQDFNFYAITKDDVEDKILADDVSSPEGKEN